MKTQILFLKSLIISLLLFSGCQSEENQAAFLHEEVKTLKEIEQRSGRIENSENAFTVLRDLNQTLGDIRDEILSMEVTYREVSENEKQQLESEFNTAQSEIDRSLKVISTNIEPYKTDKRVSKMLVKLDEIMISK